MNISPSAGVASSPSILKGRRTAPAAILGALAAACAGPALAQATTGTTNLGEVIVTGTRAERPGAQAFLGAAEIGAYEAARVSEALTLLPAVHPQPGNRGGSRNEQTIYVRGFDQSRVPVLLDGIPIYVPYDGYIDLARLPTFALAGIEVAKGYTSVLYGPNALGGAINLVSRRPTAALEAQASARLDFDRRGETQGYRTDLLVGVLRDGWYAQAGAAILDRDHSTLSKDFDPGVFQPAGKRRRSASRDLSANLKLGLTPNAADEYALTLVWQDGEKQAPPYAGSIAANGVFFDWPQYDKRSVYLNGRTALGGGQLKTRLFYDRFENSLRRYDTDSYATQFRPFAFTSFYSDYTFGGSAEYALPELAGWQATGALHLKKDVHRENSLNGPRSRMEDVTSSFALAVERDLTPDWRLFLGASYDRRDAGRAQDPSTNGASLFATKDQDGWNAQAGVVGEVGPGTLRASVSRKVRFATLFERYSYRLGNGLPNPGLKPETAVNYEIGYLWRVSPGLTLDASAFVSDFDDIIQSATVRAGPPVVSQSQNIGEARISGVELTARAELPAGARLIADYTYLDRDLRNRPGLRLFGTPHHTLNLRGEVPLGPVILVPSLLARSSQDTSDLGGGAPIDGYVLTNLKGAWRVTDQVSLEAGVTNLFDKSYEFDLGFPAAGREFFLSVKASL